MYSTGELEEVMKSFEKSIAYSKTGNHMPSVYIGTGGLDRAEKVEVETEEGRIAKRYRSNNYYNNGNVNQLFIAYLWGYASGKSAA